MATITKTCKTCSQTKPETDFYIQYKNTGTRFAHCKKCQNQKRKNYKVTNGKGKVYYV